MNIAAMRVRVTFQKNAVTVDKYGNHKTGWTDYFSMEKWLQAFADCGVDPKWYAQREWGENEVFPWETISIGIPKKFFWKERQAAYRSEITPDCRKQCTGCGANRLYTGGVCDE